jgi:sugar/nucleoside kinase (ribokinase family)
VSFDVAIVGAPFLDLTFEGLERIPGEGEELMARSVHIGPGGTGMQAIAAARLGLSVALVAPVGETGPAGLVRETLLAESVTIVFDRDATRPVASLNVPITALLTTPHGVAMTTAIAGAEPSIAEVAGSGAPTAVTSLGRLGLAPAQSLVYAVTGGLELDSLPEETMQRLASVHALIVNGAEATVLTGLSDPGKAALELARTVRTAVVTLGGSGAVAAQRQEITEVPAPDVEVVDATGAGDLFTAAYVWSDLRGASLKERLAWASLYASLSTRFPTALSGALHLEDFLVEGEERGLALPSNTA